MNKMEKCVSIMSTPVQVKEGPLRKVLVLLILAAALSLIPIIATTQINGGQLSKQTHDAAWALSYSQGKTMGIFPLRTFLEIYHNDIIPWATEFPIYTFTVGMMNRLSGIPLIVCGRLLSFALYLFMLVGGWRWGRDLKSNHGRPYADLLVPFFLAWFPVFRIYAVSFMPDMGMTAFSLWGLYYCFKDSWYRAAIFLMVAALFKYYAVFITLGAMIHLCCFNRKGPFLRRMGVLAAGALPAVLFVLYFVENKISNPIVDYLNTNHHGHFSSLQLLLSSKLYLRIFTWLVIKNPSVPGTLLALIGLYSLVGPRWARSQENHRILNFFLPFYLGQVFFVLVFAHGFFIHDYYSLPTILFPALLAALGAQLLLHRHTRASLSILAFLMAGTVVLSLVMTRSALFPQPFYSRLAQELEHVTAPSDRVLVVGDRATELPLFNSGRVGWMLPTIDWEREIRQDHLKGLLTQGRVRWVLLYCLGEGVEGRVRDMQRQLQAQFPQLLLEQQSGGLIPSEHQKVPTVFYSLYRVKIKGQS